jgi:hypothetical protein
MESVQRVEPFMPWCYPGLTESEQRAWIEAQVTAFQTRTAFEFAIVGYAERYLGGCGLNQFDVLNRRANWGLSSAINHSAHLPQSTRWCLANVMIRQTC